jgi:hypothetical protein
VVRFNLFIHQSFDRLLQRTNICHVDSPPFSVRCLPIHFNTAATAPACKRFFFLVTTAQVS